MRTEKPVLLIDGDLYLHRGTVAVEQETRWDDENHMLYSNEEEGWTAVTWEIAKVANRFDLSLEDKDNLIICISTPPLFRTEVDPSYKAGRAKTRKPMAYTAVRERMTREFTTIAFAGLEADDVMGMLATRPGNGDTIICSLDKDMKQVPGRLWNGSEFMSIDEVTADLFFLTQVLTGDTSDGYKGCPGVGPVKAAKILQTAIDRNAHLAGDAINCCWDAVVEAFEAAGLTADDAIVQARLARILRWNDWDPKKKEVKLWQPPT